jgi:two-component system LytT family response regulator
MTLRTVIVDDEPLARDLLAALLANHEDIRVVAQCRDGEEAISCLQTNAVDLLLLDVQMPETGGFEVLERLGLQHLPPTVFVTAYHQHAVRAFDVHAIDYLTKPVTAERLALGLDRVREKIAARAALLTQEQFAAVLNGLRSNEQAKSYVLRILVKDGEKEILLPVERIDWIEASDYYCCLHSNERSYMLRETISDLMGQGSIRLAGGQVLKMSKSGRERLLELGKI